jgi:hypothetical protein
MKDFYELLKEGFTPEEITQMMNMELANAIEKDAAEKAAAMAELAKEQEQDEVKSALSEARAHLLSAIAIYNEVFKFAEIGDSEIATLEEALKEIEDYIINNREVVDVYIKMMDSQGKNKGKKRKGYSIFDMFGF